MKDEVGVMEENGDAIKKDGGVKENDDGVVEEDDSGVGRLCWFDWCFE